MAIVDVRIDEAGADDLAAIEAALPAPPGTTSGRLDRHLRGETTLLLARTGGAVAGRAELLWAGCAAPEVAAVLWGVPEVNGLEVAAAVRGRGVGTALLAAAAAAVRVRGLGQIGLGVEPSNPRALALYRRLGFDGALPYVDRYTITDDAGVDHHEADACVFLVAATQDVLLQASSDQAPSSSTS